jgi:hypothetical protein
LIHGGDSGVVEAMLLVPRIEKTTIRRMKTENRRFETGRSRRTTRKKAKKTNPTLNTSQITDNHEFTESMVDRILY